MPSLYESTAIVGEVSSSNFTTLYNSSGLSAPNSGGGAVGGNLNVSGNLTVQGTSLLQGAVVLGSTLSTPNYTFPLPDGTTDQVIVTDGSGNLYWTDVSAIPGAAYSIEANTATGGANLTLVDSAGGTDNVKFAGGTNITVSRTDANTITISTVADNIPDGTGKGQVLYWDGTAWTAATSLVFDDTNYRTRFVNNVAGGITAVEFLKQFSGTLADGSTVGNFWGFWDGAGLSNSDFKMTHRAQSEYDSAGNNIFRIQTDPVGNFGPTSTTVYSQLRVDNNTLDLNGNNILLGLNVTGAPTLDATITVNRGSSTDAVLKWNETDDRWEFTNALYVTGNYSQDGDSMTINADNTAVDSYLYMKGGSEYLKWNNTDTRFEFSDQIYNTLNDVPAKFERQVLTSEINVPTESKTALRLLERVTDAPNNDTVVTGPGITFGRTSGASAATEQIYAQIGSSWDGANDKVWMFFNGSTDNFDEPTPGNFPGSFTMLALKTDEAYFKNNSIYVDYTTPGSPQIGINTASPNYTLDVNGTTNTVGQLSLPSMISNTVDPIYAIRSIATTNVGVRALSLRAESTGTPTVGFGTLLDFEVETSSTNTERAGYIGVSSTDITSGSEDFAMSFGLMQNGATYDSKMELNSAGDLQIDGDLTVTGTNITTGVDLPIIIDRSSALTTVGSPPLFLRATSTGTPTVGFGTSLGFIGQTTTSNFENAAYISVNSTDITSGSEDFSMNFGLMQNGAVYANKMVLDSAGNLDIDGGLDAASITIDDQANINTATLTTTSTATVPLTTTTRKKLQ